MKNGTDQMARPSPVVLPHGEGMRTIHHNGAVAVRGYRTASHVLAISLDSSLVRLLPVRSKSLCILSLSLLRADRSSSLGRSHTINARQHAENTDVLHTNTRIQLLDARNTHLARCITTHCRSRRSRRSRLRLLDSAFRFFLLFHATVLGWRVRGDRYMLSAEFA